MSSSPSSSPSPSPSASAAMRRVRQQLSMLSTSAASSSSSSPSSSAPLLPLPYLPTSSLSRHLRISPSVLHALRHGLPIVALESTIISHGMPYPRNLTTALSVESVARANGCVPATIAILNGVICVGLDDDQLMVLSKEGSKCAKVSRRDLSSIVASRLHGATTVAATMYIASLCGISIFVTGGIGGVHRGYESTMDISADLSELSRTPVTVVCAGVKSILDIKRTLEYLETSGVPVTTFGSSTFPAFFTRDSGCASPLRVDTYEHAASSIHAAHELMMTNGAVIAVPIPREFEAQGKTIEEATQVALREADSKGIEGRDITPYLLGRIAELTGGASLDANIALIKNNVKIGSRIAVELTKIKRDAASKVYSSSSASSSLLMKLTL